MITSFFKKAGDAATAAPVEAEPTSSKRPKLVDGIASKDAEDEDVASPAEGTNGGKGVFRPSNALLLTSFYRVLTLSHAAAQCPAQAAVGSAKAPSLIPTTRTVQK
jgi:hypothetical protein